MLIARHRAERGPARPGALIAAALRRELDSQGQAIGMADGMIAAVCIANDGVLLTRNRKHLERVEGLKPSPVTGE